MVCHTVIVMTELKQWTRDEALAERSRLLDALEQMVGTTHREELRRLSLSGALRDDAAPLVEELRTLDYLLDES